MYNQGAMKMDHEYINGYRLIENRHMTKTKMAIKRNPGQTQKPRAVRIVKKKPVRVTNRRIIAHPVMIQKLIREVEAQRKPKPMSRAGFGFRTDYGFKI